MGRKIPAKKHRGVKDPVEQHAKRLQILKTKINAPPKDPDEQPVPRSLTRLFAFQNNDKKPNKKKIIKRLHHGKEFNNGSGVGDNPVSRLRKMPSETGREFSLRINSAIRALHDPLEQMDYPKPFRDRYIEAELCALLYSSEDEDCDDEAEDFEAEDVVGEKMAANRERRERKRRRAKAGKGGDNEEEHLTRTQRLALKKKEKQLKALEASKERQEIVYERVAFGEVSHAPPALHFKPKKGKTDDSAPRPGRRDLLLTKLLNNTNSNGPMKSDLPPVELMRRERARLDAVAAYRALKASKMKTKIK